MHFPIKITLRHLAARDLALLVQIETDPANCIYSGSTDIPEIEDLIALMHDESPFWESHQKRFTIEYHNEAVGFADLFDADFDLKSSYVGIFILPEFRQKKIALHALQLLWDEARSFDLITLKAKCLNNNKASIALFQKAGFMEESSTNELTLLCKTIDS